MYSAIIFLGGANAMAVQSVVNVERKVFYRERAAGMYSSMAYAFAQVSIEIMYVAVQSFVYSLILFFMLGFSLQANKFLWFLYFISMSFLYFTMFGLMMISLTPNPEVASIFMFFFITLWNLFSGFLIPRPLMPGWWRWYYWLNPVAWTLYGVVTSQVGDRDSLVEIPGESSIPAKLFLKDAFGYEYSFLNYAALFHVMFILIFFVGFAFGIKYLNFQKR